jgi:uncharacterized protein
MKPVVWIISEGSPGHISQSEGLVTALAEQLPLEWQVIDTRPRFGGFTRRLVRYWMSLIKGPLPTSYLKHQLRCSPPANSTPRLIVTSGGKAVFAARSLALKHKASLIFIGERKPYPSKWFHTVFTPSPFETDVNDVPLEMIPTRITHAAVNEAADSWGERPTETTWAMIIGGASVSHDYQDSDWILLAKHMNQLAKSNQIRWLISTSRRTGAAAEALLRQHLEPSLIARTVWWAEKPEKLMARFLGSASWVFVTQDSVTMVTEAVASGRPTLVIRPERTRFAAASFLPGYYEKLESNKRIKRLGISNLADFSPVLNDFIPRTQPIQDELACLLLQRIQTP